MEEDEAPFEWLVPEENNDVNNNLSNNNKIIELDNISTSSKLTSKFPSIDELFPFSKEDDIDPINSDDEETNLMEEEELNVITNEKQQIEKEFEQLLNILKIDKTKLIDNKKATSNNKKADVAVAALEIDNFCSHLVQHNQQNIVKSAVKIKTQDDGDKEDKENIQQQGDVNEQLQQKEIANITNNSTVCNGDSDGGDDGNSYGNNKINKATENEKEETPTVGVIEDEEMQQQLKENVTGLFSLLQELQVEFESKKEELRKERCITTSTETTKNNNNDDDSKIKQNKNNKKNNSNKKKVILSAKQKQRRKQLEAKKEQLLLQHADGDIIDTVQLNPNAIVNNEKNNTTATIDKQEFSNDGDNTSCSNNNKNNNDNDNNDNNDERVQSINEREKLLEKLLKEKENEIEALRSQLAQLANDNK